MSVVRLTDVISLACCLISLLSASLVAQGSCAWSPLGSGVGPPGVGVRALAVFDDGSGAALYAGGGFVTAGGVAVNRIAKWDRFSWSSLTSGLNGNVWALTVFDDGTGPALYAGGSFTTAGGVPANGIARWDGTSWSPLGSGVTGANVYSLTVFDDGTGPALYVGGAFQAAGGASADRIARWDGVSWSPLGTGMDNAVTALATFDDGTGPALYAGGYFATAGGAPAIRAAKWDGSTWSPLGSGIPGSVLFGVYSLTVFDDGLGPALYAGGEFTTTGAAGDVARWDGSTWSSLGAPQSGDYVLCLSVFDDGTGPALYAGRGVGSLSRWDGSSWSSVSGFSGGVASLAVFDDGSPSDVAGSALCAGGIFTTAGPAGANHLARWSCGSTISLSATQPGGPGAPVFVNNANLAPGSEYYNLFAVACPTGPATCWGPLGANWTTQNVSLVLRQMTRPVGTEPFHVVAPSSYVNWGPYNLPPLTLDALCINFSGGSIGATSPMVRITVQ